MGWASTSGAAPSLPAFCPLMVAMAALIACEADPADCPSSPCPAGQSCFGGQCVAGGGTDAGPACAADQIACGGVCCAAGQICSADRCAVPVRCAADEVVCANACCTSAQECLAAACQPRCDNLRCGPQQTCCGQGEVCVDQTACCAADKACGGACCGADQLCVAGQCKRDCNGAAPCGPSEVCCGAGEVCHLDACVRPGRGCGGAGGCATNPDQSVCPPGQFCDPGLARCLPSAATDTCEYAPPVGVFDPVPLFTWGQRRRRTCTQRSDCQKEERCVAGTCEITWPHVVPGADDMPMHFQVSSIPMVTDLDADCVPDIVFNTYKNSDFTTDGVLRAIRGDDGAKVWTVTDPMYRTNATANPAIGDLDGDGAPEVLVQGVGRTLLCFAADGTPRWRSEALTGAANSGSAAIANLDGEGDAEIVFGGAVFSSAGALLWEGTGGHGIAGQGPISCVADLDGDGRQEVVAGRTAYQTTGTAAAGTFAGTERWSSMTPDGYCGIADLDGDMAPEVVLVAQGTIYVLGGQLGAIRAQVTIPGGGQGGAPNIADFDGDGRPDIGTAGASNYVVARYDGAARLEIVWAAPTEDDSSSRTGSSVFDFDGDGAAEVVYNDEEFLRIYPGIEPDCRMSPPGPGCDGTMRDDEIIFRDLNSSRTRTEYPVIADVNGDFKAEIVFATSNEASFLDPALTGDAGIEVWRDKLDNWVATRPVWNQHAYHITNVSLLGGIPVTEPPSWLAPNNSYRRNTQGGRELCAPDLELRAIEVDASRCPELTVSVWVVNTGCLGVGPGVNVAFGDDSLGVLGLARTSGPLIAGAAEQVSLQVTGRSGNYEFKISARVDDDGAGASSLNECREMNNDSAVIEGRCRIDL